MYKKNIYITVEEKEKFRTLMKRYGVTPSLTYTDRKSENKLLKRSDKKHIQLK